MKKIVLETIDGSIKNIIQLKTLDNSLEFSQMFDALEDTSRDFQAKLIDALNSLGETMQIPPTEAFNKVLCKSDEKNEGLRKKLYNWWRAFFEVLGKCEKIPSERVSEFNKKIDDLMAEIMKSGDAEDTDEDEPVMESSKPRFKKGDYVVVRNGDDARVLGYYRDRVDKTIWYEVWIMDGNRTTEYPDEDVYASRREYEAKYLYEEEYEQATKEDEDKMMADMDFAIQHLGEVANKVKAVVNFVNPYCETTFNEVKNNMKKTNETGASEFWKAMDDVDDLERKGYWSGKFKVGDRVMWNDPEYDEWSGGWTVTYAPEDADKDAIYTIENDDGSEAEVYGSELRPAKMANEVKDASDDWVSWDEMVGESGATKKVSLYVDWDDDGAGLDSNVVIDVPAEIADSDESTALYDYIADWIDNQDFCVNDWAITDIEGLDNDVELEGTDEGDLENELDKGDDGWVEIGQPVGESKPVELEGTDDCSNNVKFKPIGQMNEASVAVGDVVSWKDENDEMQDGWTVVGYDEISLESHLKKDGKDVWVDDVRVEEYNESNVAAEQKMVELEGTDWKEISDEDDEEVTSGEVTSGEVTPGEVTSGDVKSADVKDGEKQVTQDGETKTLVAGEEEEKKKPVCEMTIEQEIDDPWKLSELLWSQGKENLEELLRSELVGEEEIMQMLEDTGVRNLTNINDLFAFDFPSVLDSLGLDGEAWSQNLEFVKKA